jgi:L-fuconolactonase
MDIRATLFYSSIWKPAEMRDAIEQPFRKGGHMKKNRASRLFGGVYLVLMVLVLSLTFAFSATAQNVTPKQAKIVDTHCHIFSPPDIKRYPVAPAGGKQSPWSINRHNTIEELIVAMDEAGVDKAAIVQAGTVHGYDNSYLADSVALHPQRFTGVFMVDMLAPDAAEKLRYWVKERKLGGLRLLTGAITTGATQSTWLSDPKTFPVWEYAAELKIPVVVQLQPAGIPQLEVVLKQFPQVSVIIDHLMETPIKEGPPYAGSEFLFDLARYRNVYVKLTTSNVRASHEGKGSPETFFPLLVKKFGASRIAWGSNYPASEGTLKGIVNEAKSALASLPEEDQQWIFARTAQSLYPALADK